MKNYINELINWIRYRISDAGLEGVVFGLSGGLDSSVLAALCAKAYPDKALGLIMPCYSNAEDEEHARLVAEAFDISFNVIVLDDVLDLFMSKFGEEENYAHWDLAIANVKPRLRMTCLYYYAAKNKYLVAGSSNRSEMAAGYFTKYGDSAVDIMPLANLLKSQVKEIAADLGVPREIIEKPPSGGLWPEQTDEGEMGITYAELDNYLLGRESDKKVKETIDKMIKGAEHKKKLPPVPDF